MNCPSAGWAVAGIEETVRGAHGGYDSRPICFRSRHRSDACSSPAQSAAVCDLFDPCTVALLPHHGDEPVDRDISRAQDRAREAADSIVWLERLGWLFTAKARRSYDPGYWKLAEQCGLCMAARRPHSPEALLLLGHVLDSLHRFHEAETMARELVDARGLYLDWGLLGDALMEEGRLDEAIEAYQKMIDLKPGPQSYSRAAHVRWLKGDLRGAIELARMAARASDPRDSDSSAWSYSRLALYELQAGDAKRALRAARSLCVFDLTMPGPFSSAGASCLQAATRAKRSWRSAAQPR